MGLALWHTRFVDDMSELLKFGSVIVRAQSRLGDAMRMRINQTMLDNTTLSELETGYRELSLVSALLNAELDRIKEHINLQLPAAVVRGDAAVLGLYEPRQVLERFQDLFYPVYYYMVKLVSYVDHGFDAEFYLRSYHDRNYAMIHERDWLMLAGRRVFDTLVRNRISQTLFAARRLTHAVLDRGVRQSIMSYALMFTTIFYPLQYLYEQIEYTPGVVMEGPSLKNGTPPAGTTPDVYNLNIMPARLICSFLNNPVVWFGILKLLCDVTMDGLAGGHAQRLAKEDMQRKHSFANQWLEMATTLTTGQNSTGAASMLAMHSPVQAAGLVAASMGTSMYDQHQEAKYKVANNALLALDFANKASNSSPLFRGVFRLLVYALVVATSMAIMSPTLIVGNGTVCETVMGNIINNFATRASGEMGLTSSWTWFTSPYGSFQRLFKEKPAQQLQTFNITNIAGVYSYIVSQKQAAQDAILGQDTENTRGIKIIAVTLLVFAMAALQEATVGEQLDIGTIGPQHRWVNRPGSIVHDGPNPYNFEYPAYLLSMHKRAAPYPDTDAFLARCTKLHGRTLAACKQAAAELMMPTVQHRLYKEKASSMQQMLATGAATAKAPPSPPRPKIDYDTMLYRPSPETLTDRAQGYVNSIQQRRAQTPAPPPPPPPRRRASTKQAAAAAAPDMQQQPDTSSSVQALSALSREQLANIARERGLKPASKKWTEVCGGYTKAAILQLLTQ
jgi:hypothetical protein